MHQLFLHNRVEWFLYGILSRALIIIFFSVELCPCHAANYTSVMIFPRPLHEVVALMTGRFIRLKIEVSCFNKISKVLILNLLVGVL